MPWSLMVLPQIWTWVPLKATVIWLPSNVIERVWNTFGAMVPTLAVARMAKPGVSMFQAAARKSLMTPSAG